jgi:hypothetical protein
MGVRMFIFEFIFTVISVFLAFIFGAIDLLLTGVMFVCSTILAGISFVFELVLDGVFFIYEKTYLEPKEKRDLKKVQEELEQQQRLYDEKIEKDTINHPIKIDFDFNKLGDRKKKFNAWIKSKPNYKKVYLTLWQPNGTTPFYVYCKEPKDEVLFKLTWS